MLDYIRIRNLRSLEDTGNIKLSPLTVLLGENSSGKSTFLRTFPLLKQSVEASTRSSILWYGKYVDYGDFDQALNRNNNCGEISFLFGLTVPKILLLSPGFSRRQYRHDTNDKGAKIAVEIRLASRGKDGLTRTAGLHVLIEDNEVDISINDQGRIFSLNVNGRDCSQFADLFSYSQTARLLPSVNSKQDSAQPPFFRSWSLKKPPEKLRQIIFKELSTFMHGRANDRSMDNTYSQLYLGSKIEMFNYFRTASSTMTWKYRTSGLAFDSQSFEHIRDLVILSKIPALISDIDDILDMTFRRISYTAPIRASAERYYRSQDLSVNELDYKGENLAMFVRHLSERDKQSLDTWTRKEFGFKFDVKYSGGHVTAGIEYDGSKESFNLADMGFGFSQVMPIIVQVWTLINRSQRSMSDPLAYTYLIEQPELHLHPRLQAKLADVLIKAVMQARKNDIKINLIFETHSEAIINKIGLMIADKQISSTDANILIFSKKNEVSGTSVTVSGFDDDGILKDWPYGFFDIEV